MRFTCNRRDTWICNRRSLLQTYLMCILRGAQYNIIFDAVFTIRNKALLSIERNKRSFMKALTKAR